MKKCFYFLLLLLIAGVSAKAQVVTTYPLFPVDGNNSVTIYFHGDQGNQGLLNYPGSVYVHTGVVTASATSTTWTNVVTAWGTAGALASNLTTYLGNNTWSFTINNIRSFYGVTAGTTIYKIAILFRSASGDTVGRDVGGADIFIPVIQAGTFAGRFFTPVTQPDLLPVGTNTLTSLYGTSQNATIQIYQNGALLNTYTNTDSIQLSLTGTSGTNWVKAVANNGTTTRTDSFSYIVIPPASVAALPAGAKDGVNYINDSTVTLVLVAPHKNNVFVIGEFNNFTPDTAYSMHPTPDSTRFWRTITHLTPGSQYSYQYLVDGSIKIADPYTEMVLDPYNDPYITANVYPNLKAYPTGQSGNVSVLQPGKPAYTWTATNYQKPAKENLVIYELLVRDFLADHNYHTLRDTLPYLQKLGVNAIELMPVSEFEGNESWGYNPNFYFAPDKYYGPADSLRAFIDECHKNNIAVIMDMVFNHSFSTSPMCQLYWDAANSWPATNNPWYNSDMDPSTAGYQGPHPFGVGYDFNHESPYTKKFFTDAVHHWVSDYKVDGYRFDLAKGFTQTYTGSDVSAWGNYDQSRINIWEGYADSMWAQDPSTYVILEYFAGNDEEKILANDGMMLWGPNMANAYEQSGMSYLADANSSADLSSMSYQNLGWSKPGLVGYMESHDEERVMYKNEQYGNASGAYNIKNLDTALNRIKLNSAFFFPIPGPKMIWQFEELGYDTSINADGGNTANKPILWNYQNNPARYLLNKTMAALIHLKTAYPAAFNTTSYTLNVGNYKLRSIYLNDASMQVAVLGNFDVNDDGGFDYTFTHTGKWYEYFTGDSITVTGSTYNIALRAGEYRLYTSVKLPAPDLSVPPNLSVGNTVLNTASQPHLYQNYPNPFRSVSTVDFSLPQSTTAKLELFDVLGRKIVTVADRKFGAGNYTFNLNAGDMPSGTYYLVLSTSDGFRQSITVSTAK